MSRRAEPGRRERGGLGHRAEGSPGGGVTGRRGHGPDAQRASGCCREKGRTVWAEAPTRAKAGDMSVLAWLGRGG